MGKYLSSNSKTGVSINLPLANCSPTKVCFKICYAKSGPIAFKNSRAKQIRVSEYLLQSDITELVSECKNYSTVRLNGTGDLLTEQVDSILNLAKSCPSTTFYGMTKKIEIANMINGKLPNLSILVSIDSSSPMATKEYKGMKCYTALPTDNLDEVKKDDSIVVVFPYHSHGKIVNKIESEKNKTTKDCPIVRDVEGINSCLDCGKCWSWKGGN